MQITRDINLTNRLILLDGITGTGKTMFLSLLNSSSNTMAGQFNYEFEYISIFAKLNKIDINEASVLLNLIADGKYYNNLISREVNFRPNDLSSVLKSGKAIQYIRQLFAKDGIHVEARLAQQKPIMTFVTHQLFSALKPAFEGFKERLFVIEMERHPLFLLKHWLTWIDLYGQNARDMTVWLKHQGTNIPWFALGWEDRFLQAGTLDRAIYSLEWLTNESLNAYSGFPQNQILFIPFEDFVLRPEKYLLQIQEILHEPEINKLIRSLKKQNVPRKNIFDGPDKKIYRRYAFQKNMASRSHEETYKELLDYANANSSEEAFSVLLDLNSQYENKYGKWF